MTLIELLFAVCVIADVILHSLVLLVLRDTLHTLALRESARRLWPRRADDAAQVRRAVARDAEDA